MCKISVGLVAAGIRCEAAPPTVVALMAKKSWITYARAQSRSCQYGGVRWSLQEKVNGTRVLNCTRLRRM